jgi:glycine/D-amino acid oxidase-like deaminating enzyme
METRDVVIAGGGATGSAVAYFLSRQPEFSGSLLVIEPDPTYAFAASARSASSIRRQFSTPLNIALSRFGWEVLRTGRAARNGAISDRADRADRTDRTDHTNITDIPDFADLAEVGLTESTYLFLASAAGVDALRRNVAVQRRCGVGTRLHEAGALRERYPWMNTSDLAAAADTAGGEGWFDGYALLKALRHANERRGVRYLRDRVVALKMSGPDRIEAVRLQGGDTLPCHWLVNAAGTRARELAAHAGIDVPVYPRKRCVFVFRSETPVHCPLVVDTSGLWFRPEGQGYICGPVPLGDPDVAPDDFEVDHPLFEEIAWPALAHRVPAFAAVRVTGAWAGHYDYNVFDQNAFVGPCEAVPNLLLACGFSGHGLQHAPGIGRALAEFITFGEYRSLDLARFTHARFTRGQPLREINVI